MKNKPATEPATTVTQEQVDGAIKALEVKKMGAKTTVVLATLHNGFEVLASSSCVDEKNYDEDIGESLATSKIKEKIWELLGFLLQEKLKPTPEQPITEPPTPEPLPA